MAFITNREPNSKSIQTNQKSEKLIYSEIYSQNIITIINNYHEKSAE